MSDFFAPSYWYGAGPDFSGLQNAYASQASNQNYMNNQNATLAAANSYNPWANTPGGFGGQTAYYAGQGAAYGRATGGFNAQPGDVGTITNPGTSNPGYDPSSGRLPGQSAPGTPVSQWNSADWQQYNSMYKPGAVQRGQDLQAPATQWTPPQAQGSGGGSAGDWSKMFNPQPLAQQGGGGGGGGGGGRLAGQSAPGTPVSQWTSADWQQYNSLFGGAGGAGQNEGQGGGAGGIGSDTMRDQYAWTLARGSPYATPQKAPSSPNIGNLGYNPGMENWFANPGMNANPFQNRFGLGFGGQAPTMRPDYSSNPLSSMDIYGTPHSFGPGVYQNSPFGNALP